MRLLLIGLLSLSSLGAQVQAEQSQIVLGAGAAASIQNYQPPQAVGWGAIAVRVAQNVYSFSSVLVKPQRTTTLSGLAAQFCDEGLVRLYGFGQGGLESGSGQPQGVYAGGGFGLVNLGRYIKAPQIDLVLGVRLTRVAGGADPSAVNAAFFWGLAWHSIPK